jgi:uncharacterized membrane protein
MGHTGHSSGGATINVYLKLALWTIIFLACVWAMAIHGTNINEGTGNTPYQWFRLVLALLAGSYAMHRIEQSWKERNNAHD